MYASVAGKKNQILRYGEKGCATYGRNGCLGGEIKYLVGECCSVLLDQLDPIAASRRAAEVRVSELLRREPHAPHLVVVRSRPLDGFEEVRVD